MSEWVDICKAGTWTARDGRSVTLTEGDLDAIVSGYAPSEREAPLVLGHPADDAPAFGWVEALRRVGSVLQAKFKDVASEVKELVAGGRYKKVSIALFPDGVTLRHIGLLGAAQPAVSGLRSVRFEEGSEGITLEFSSKEEAMEKEELQRRLEEQLERQTQQLREAQRRNDQLNERLEAVRAIERSLTTRPAPPAAAQASPPGSSPQRPAP